MLAWRAWLHIRLSCLLSSNPTRKNRWRRRQDSKGLFGTLWRDHGGLKCLLLPWFEAEYFSFLLLCRVHSLLVDFPKFHLPSAYGSVGVTDPHHLVQLFDMGTSAQESTFTRWAGSWPSLAFEASLLPLPSPMSSLEPWHCGLSSFVYLLPICC